MDAGNFDRLSRTLVTAGSRRGLLGLLSALPIAGILIRGSDTSAKPGRKHRRRHAQRHQGTHERHDARSEACIPTGQRCPSRKVRGKKGKKLGCNACCQGSFITEASGKKVCGCRPNGGSCTPDTASSCCSGYCDDATCQASRCSGTAPCPTCQTCSAATGLCEVATDGTFCDDGNACTQTDSCQGGVCVGSNPVVCPGPPDACHLGGLCNPATGLCGFPTQLNGTPCGGSNICCTGTCWDGCCDSNGEPSACLVFVTSTPYTGDLKGSSATGLEGADAKCQELANLAAGGSLPGTYKAWLSSGNGPNESPATGRFRHSGQPYTLVDAGATRIAANWTALTSGTLEHAIDLNENGDATSLPIVWTDTTADGTLRSATATCGSWSVSTGSSTGLVGNCSLSNAGWTADANAPQVCSHDFRLYCFQQD